MPAAQSWLSSVCVLETVTIVCGSAEYNIITHADANVSKSMPDTCRCLWPLQPSLVQHSEGSLAVEVTCRQCSRLAVRVAWSTGRCAGRQWSASRCMTSSLVHSVRPDWPVALSERPLERCDSSTARRSMRRSAQSSGHHGVDRFNKCCPSGVAPCRVTSRSLASRAGLNWLDVFHFLC